MARRSKTKTAVIAFAIAAGIGGWGYGTYLLGDWGWDQYKETSVRWEQKAAAEARAQKQFEEEKAIEKERMARRQAIAEEKNALREKVNYILNEVVDSCLAETATCPAEIAAISSSSGQFTEGPFGLTMTETEPSEKMPMETGIIFLKDGTVQAVKCKVTTVEVHNIKTGEHLGARHKNPCY